MYAKPAAFLRQGVRFEYAPNARAKDKVCDVHFSG